MPANCLPIASPHQPAPTSAGVASEPSVFRPAIKSAACLTSGESRVAVLLSGLAYAPPAPKTNGAKRAQSAPMQKPEYLPVALILAAAFLRSSQVQFAVGSGMPAAVKASGR